MAEASEQQRAAERALQQKLQDAAAELAVAQVCALEHCGLARGEGNAPVLPYMLMCGAP